MLNRRCFPVRSCRHQEFLRARLFEAFRVPVRQNARFLPNQRWKLSEDLVRSNDIQHREHSSARSISQSKSGRDGHSGPSSIRQAKRIHTSHRDSSHGTDSAQIFRQIVSDTKSVAHQVALQSLISSSRLGSTASKRSAVSADLLSSTSPLSYF